MKISKTMLGGAALFGMAGIASAQNPPVDIYITGSTAFRATAVTEIGNLLGTNGVTTASDKTPITGANVVNFYGGKINGTPVTIKVSWSGSGAGIQTVGAQSGTTYTAAFLPDQATGGANPNPQTVANAPVDAAIPDMTFSDVFQGTTPFNGTFNGTTYATLVPQGTSSYVGVAAFTFAASKGFPTGQTMTSQIAQQLFTVGDVPLSFFTGTAANLNVGVIATGRNVDSGTRLTAAAETNIGVNTALQQYKPTVTGVDANGFNGTITNLALYPAAAINGVQKGTGDGGESSGGNLRPYLTDTLNQSAINNVDSSFTGGYLVTYLGLSDFGSVSGNGAVQLAYDGVMESPVEIEQGAYTFWSYEHLYYKNSLGTGNSPAVKLNFATSLSNFIINSASISPNVPLNSMQVQRTGDGGIVSSLFH